MAGNGEARNLREQDRAGVSRYATAAGTPNDTPNTPQRQAVSAAIRAQLAVLRFRFGITEAEALALAALVWGAR